MGKRHLILIGPSGTGKSSVAVQLAGQLGWPWRDSDEQVEQQAGRSVAEIFRELGEPAFRLLESGAVARACHAQAPMVIAVGGGAVLDAANRALIAEHGRVIYLMSRAEDILQRLRSAVDPHGLPSRPLLAGSDPLARINEQIAARHFIYQELAEYQLGTIGLGVDAVADKVVQYLEQHPAQNINVGNWRVLLQDGILPIKQTRTIMQKAAGLLAQHPEAFSDERELAAIAEQVASESASIRVIVDEGLWNQVEEGFAFYRERMTFRITIASSDQLSPENGVDISLPPREQQHYLLPSGEAAKSAAQLDRIYDWLAETRTERGDIVVAIGGGATGDVAGYAAATYLRGLRVVQVPTTLLAMVDAAIGGKTAINKAGKNMVGAFHQPWHIIIDPNWLRTLPPRDYASGWGEICKYAMIEASIGYGSSGFLALLEQNVALLSAVPSESDVLLTKQMGGRSLDLYREGNTDKRLLAKVISRCAGLKAQVVAADEREREGGLRVLLNYGHTLGHALEKATGYDAARLLHGEGVAIGMTAAAMIAERLGVCDPALLTRQSALLHKYGLPTSWAHLDLNRDEVLAAMQLDKKARGQRVRWVLPTALGKVELRDDVPPTLAAEVIAELGSRR